MAAVQAELAAGENPALAKLKDGYFKVRRREQQWMVCLQAGGPRLRGAQLPTAPSRCSTNSLAAPKHTQGVIKHRGLSTPEVDTAVARVMAAHAPAVAAAARAAGEALLREPLQVSVGEWERRGGQNLHRHIR